MNQLKKEEFIGLIEKSLSASEFVSLALLNKRNKTDELKKISIRFVNLKAGSRLSFVSRFPTNDITKNYSIEKGLELISELLESTFSQAELTTNQKDLFLSYPEKGKTKITEKLRAISLSSEGNHDHLKHRHISESQAYLKFLGVTNEQGAILKNKQAKFKQINKFIEIIDPIIQKSNLKDNYTVFDMGSGKGYLTFALYDHLNNNLKHNVAISGIELRKSLVDQCNNIASTVGFDKLRFLEGSIENNKQSDIDVLIALHACNTATDDAIAKGIKSGAELIICSPCCHKQIRKQMKPDSEINSITQFGILKERQAEILTDTIRALILEGYGYKTNVMEFISTEHTPKNLLIVGTKKTEVEKFNPAIRQRIDELKERFGVDHHHLEKLLGLFQT